MQQLTESQRNLFLLLTLFIKNTEALYVPQFEPFLHVAHWLELVDLCNDYTDGIYSTGRSDNIPTDTAPDICASCLSVLGTCSGGRIRTRCALCQGLTWSQHFYNDPWPYRAALLLGISQEEYEYVLSQVLFMFKQIKEGQDTTAPQLSTAEPRTASSHEDVGQGDAVRAVTHNKETNGQIQPNITDDSRVDTTRIRRFNIRSA